jgi:phosphatidate cytidylyltransferase
LLYAAAALFGAVLVRADPQSGFIALLFVLLVVWITDIGGYFAGRGIGGPKLWVRVSPKKTWAGAIGGFAGSLAVAAGFAASGFGRMVPLLLLGAVLSMVSQLGDLFESAVKRHFGVKDSSNVIPGHGGLLDRLDGFVAAIVMAAVIGVIRGGFDGVGRGLVIWGLNECSTAKERSAGHQRPARHHGARRDRFDRRQHHGPAAARPRALSG